MIEVLKVECKVLVLLLIHGSSLQAVDKGFL